MTKKILTVATMFLLLSLPAAAADKGGIDIKSISEIEMVTTSDKGEKEVKRIEASQANIVPGDTVIFTNRYVNRGEKPAENVIITNPVPEHTIYIDGTAEGSGARIEFSVDKGKKFAAPEKLKVNTQDGKERPAIASDYTHIKWTIEKSLAKGAEGSVSFRAKVK